MVTIAFAGGGTGGHIYPALAVLQELKKLSRDFRVFWIGSSSGMDRRIVEEAGVEFYGISCGKLRRYFSFKNFTDIFKILAGFFAAKKILKKQKVNLLFSKGGFVSVPPCAAAASLKIKVYTHESDFSPGLATRLNARYVKRTGGKIFTSYDETRSLLKENFRPLVLQSGNPVRSSFRGASGEKGRAFLNITDNERVLLVLGGSQGAHEVNELVRAALPQLTKLYTVVHQTGHAQAWDIGETEKYKPYPYIKEEMPYVMAASEVIMGRSGAGIWEWAAQGKPMILIPLRGSGTRGDQVENAKVFEKAGAALVLKGEEANPDSLAKTVELIAQDAQKRNAMSASSLKMAKHDSAAFIAEILFRETKGGFH